MLNAFRRRTGATAWRLGVLFTFLVCLIPVANAAAAEAAPGVGAEGGGDFVPLPLVRRAAAFYASQRWPDRRLISITPYFALDGSVNAYAAQFAAKDSPLTSESELSTEVAARERAAALVEASRPVRRTEPEDPFAAGRAHDGPGGGKIGVSITKDSGGRAVLHAVVPREVLAAARKRRAPAEEDTKAVAAWRRKNRDAANAAALPDQVGTVIVAARYDLYPLLERFDGAAPHLKHASRAAKLVGRGGRGAKLQRSYYLGPLAVFHEMKIEPSEAGRGREIVAVDTLRGRVLDRDKDLAARAGRLPPAPAGKRAVSPRRVWENIENAGADAQTIVGKAAGGSNMVSGVPYYHQDDYGSNCCGPTASAQVLGYWDDHGYGNLVDNGSAATGHHAELVYSLMKAEDYRPIAGTFGDKIEPGIEAVCNSSAYGNNLDFNVAPDPSVSWEDDIEAEIDAGRPFVFFNWNLGEYPFWSHFTTGVGYDSTSGHLLYVHYNYPPDTPHELNWDNIPDGNQSIFKITPAGTPAFDCVWSEDLEGGLPGPWSVGGSGAYWAGTSYISHNVTTDPSPPGGNASYWAYCAGSDVPPPGPYADNADGWMIYGPFSTLGKTTGEVAAYIRHSIADGDYVALLASLDGSDFHGEYWWAGSASWEHRALDLADVPELGDLTGRPEVWVAAWFHSDAADAAEGAYIDDITIKLSADQTLAVCSKPMTGVSIAGDKPGITNYTAVCDYGQAVSLTAPAIAMVGDIGYSFERWILDGSQAAPGQTSVQVTMDAYHSAVAAYGTEAPLLTVKSTPVTGVDIGGDRPGETNYTAFCLDNEVIHLTAPASMTVAAVDYALVRWHIDGTEQPPGQNTVQVTMDAPHTAHAEYEGEWPIPGDVNMDCVVSILDLIAVRNHLGDSEVTGDNWQYDVTKDDAINILDMLLIRNRLYTACAE